MIIQPEQPKDPAGVTGQLCNWLAELSLASIPDVVQTRAKYLLLDGIGCALVGAQLPWSRKAVEIVRALEVTSPRLTKRLKLELSGFKVCESELTRGQIT